MYAFLYTMSLADLQALQATVLASYNNLIGGKTVTVFADLNGSRMEYTRSSSADLLSYLMAIGAAIAALTKTPLAGGTRPLGFIF